MPLVSVVIPTLNRPKLLLRAIDSVLRQTYQEIEVIVIVDRPDPDTISAVRSRDDPRLQLLVNPHPLTAAGARNAGADHATGSGLRFLTITMSGCRTSWKDRSLLCLVRPRRW